MFFLFLFYHWPCLNVVGFFMNLWFSNKENSCYVTTSINLDQFQQSDTIYLTLKIIVNACYSFFFKCQCSETCLNHTMNKPKCCINQTLNKVPMQETFVNWTCINQIPFYSKHKSWSQGASVFHVRENTTILWRSGSMGCPEMLIVSQLPILVPA